MNQWFCRLCPDLALSDILSRLDWGYVFLIMSQKWCVFSVCHVRGLWCQYVSSLMTLALITWLRRCLLGFSTVKLLFLPLELINILGEICWDHGNALFLLRLSPPGVSILQWCCLQYLLLWCLPNGDFVFLVPSPFSSWTDFVQRVNPSPLLNVFIQLYLHHGLFFNSVGTVPSLILLLGFFSVLTTGITFWGLLCFRNMPLPSSSWYLFSGITRCSRLIFCFSCPSPRSKLFCKECWFLSLHNGV